MPENIADPAPAQEEATAPAEAPAASGGFKAWLPLVITVVLMPALAFGMTKFVLVPKLQKDLGISAPAESGHSNGSTESKKKDKNAKRESVTMNKLLVNVAGTMGARYLLVSLSVEGSAPDFREQVEAHGAQLKDMACGALATKTLADLEKPSARNLIRTELISGFNNILGDSMVEEIYLTEFAIQ